MRTKGKGGKNRYWFTEGDARQACEEAWGNPRQFVLQLDGGLSVNFDVGQRGSAGQWVSSDTAYQNHVLHITITIDKLELTRGDDGFTAVLTLSNPHATMRSQADSHWIGQNIGAVLRAQAAGKRATQQQTQLVQQYNQRQQRSLHAGTAKHWSGGNKANTVTAAQHLGVSQAALTTGVGDMVINLKPRLASMLAAAFGDHGGERHVMYNTEKLTLAEVDGEVRWVGDAPPVRIPDPVPAAVQPAPAIVPQPQPVVQQVVPATAAPVADEEEELGWEDVDEVALVAAAVAHGRPSEKQTDDDW